MKNFILFFCLIYLSAGFSEIVPKKRVIIGGYDFPPYVVRGGDLGYVKELIDHLNSDPKSAYEYTFKSTSANRRYKDFLEHSYDVILFEDERWGWKDKVKNYQKTKILSRGEEVFVSLKKDRRDESYFSELKDKKVRVVFGYHYNFINMDSNPDNIRKLGVTLGNDLEDNINDLINGEVDIAVLNTMWLSEYFEKKPEMRDKLLISKRIDQHYVLTALVHPKSPISPSELYKQIKIFHKSK